MTNEELNTALYEKMFAEQQRYREWLLSQPPDEILNHCYEFTVREDIVLALEYHDLSDKQCKALLQSRSPLADVFKDFEKRETDLCLIEQAHLVFAQNIAPLLTGLAEAGSLRIGKDLIHVLQLPLQLRVFLLQCFYRLDQRADELRDFRGSICDFPVCCGHEFSSQNGFNLPLLYHKGRLKYRNICNFRNIFVRIDPSVFLCG